MSNRHENLAPAPSAVSGASQKLLGLLRERVRQLLRVMLVLSIGLATGAVALAIWWLTSLNGLPDIGDPFDVAAFRASRIPDEQNAFAILRRAAGMVTPWPDLPRVASVAAPTVPWSEADPRLRAWVEANRRAIELFRQAAEQPDAIPDLAGDPSDSVNPNELSLLALLEGSRRQEGGDTSGAWDCYRAVLRMAAHVSGRGSTEQRFRVNVILLARGWLQKRLATWAADPRTTILQLRGALGEVLETGPKSDGPSFAVKIGYLEIMASMERPMTQRVRQEIEGERTYRLGEMQLPTDVVDSIEVSRRFLLREPERSRRVLRLLCANLLAGAEARGPRPVKPAVRARLRATKPISVLLYPVGPDAPAGARALPPREVASWLVATRDAKLRILSARPWPLDRLAYRRVHRELVIMLATEIYRRERGALPPSEDALVGTYLESLPDDGSADLADEMTPTIE